MTLPGWNGHSFRPNPADEGGRAATLARPFFACLAQDLKSALRLPISGGRAWPRPSMDSENSANQQHQRTEKQPKTQIQTANPNPKAKHGKHRGSASLKTPSKRVATYYPFNLGRVPIAGSQSDGMAQFRRNPVWTRGCYHCPQAGRQKEVNERAVGANPPPFRISWVVAWRGLLIGAGQINLMLSRRAEQRVDRQRPRHALTASWTLAQSTVSATTIVTCLFIASP
jgi:hypothetical protein